MKVMLRTTLVVCFACLLAPDVLAQTLPPLFADIQERDIEGVRTLLANGVSPDLAVQGTPALVFAASKAQQEIALLLVDKGASVTLPDPNGYTPLHAAMSRCLDELAGRLLDKGAKVDARAEHDTTPLHLAAQAGCTQATKLLLERKADVAARTDEGYQAVHLAAASWNEPPLQAILQAKGDPNAKANGGIRPLHLAADKKNKGCVKLLLDAGADPRVTTDDGIAPLHVAVERGDVDSTRLLLDGGADVNAATAAGLTPLLLACASSSGREIAGLLLDHAAAVNVATKDGATPLHFAVERGWDKVVQRLLDAGADASAKSNGVTPLALAREGHNSLIVGMLEKAGAAESDPLLHLLQAAADASESKLRGALALAGAADRVNGQDPNGNTPLHAAAFVGCDGCLRLLLESGAKTGVANSEGNTPLHLATGKGHWAAARVLLRYGADTSAVNGSGQTPAALAALQGGQKEFVEESLPRKLADAAHSGDADAVRAFLAQGGSPDARDDRAGLLHYALLGQRQPVVDLLLEKGADINLRPDWGEPPLFLAVRGRDAKMLEFLLSKKASLSAKGEYGATPVLVAAAVPWKEGVKLLLDKGASVADKGTIFGYGLLHYAVLGGDPELVRMLLDRGLDVHAAAGYKGTALHMAAHEGKLAIVTLLLDRGADVKAREPEYQETPLHSAANEGCVFGGDYEPIHPVDKHAFCAGKREVVELLIQKGADVNAEQKHGLFPMDETRDADMLDLLRRHGGRKNRE